MAEADEQALDAPSEALSTSEPPEGKKASAPPRRRSRAFRRELLSRLPTLGASKWESIETLNIYQDMQSIAALDADAFLQSLEHMAEDRHE